LIRMSEDFDIKEKKTKVKKEKKQEEIKARDGLTTEEIKQNESLMTPFQKGEMQSRLLEESSFSTLFPRHREQYLRQIWPLFEKHLKVYGIVGILDLREGSMTVKTTRKTWDPWAIMNARDAMKLIARSVPLEQAIKVFNDGVFMDIIKIGNATSKPRFVKRRLRLIGPNGQTLKAIELLTECYVLVHGNTVAAMGPLNGLKNVRSIVEGCMKNIHPIYSIKRLMILRELEKNPELKGENWERFLPTFKQKNVQRKVRKVNKEKKKKDKSIFPPEQTPRKEDIALESGEYFLSNPQKERIERKNKRAREAAKEQEKQEARNSVYQPPKEKRLKTEPKKDETPDLGEMVNKLKTSTPVSNKRKAENVEDYVLTKKQKKSHQKS